MLKKCALMSFPVLQDFFDNVWFSDETHYVVRNVNIFCCEVIWTLRITSSVVAHPLSTVCRGLYTLSNARRRSPSRHHWSILVQGRQRVEPPVVPAGWCHTHTANESLAWLQPRFPDRLISHRCNPEWSPYSPDSKASCFWFAGIPQEQGAWQQLSLI